MTKLSTLKIRRFKQVQDATVLLGDVTLLIGANNSGKSTVLQTLHFAVSVAQPPGRRAGGSVDGRLGPMDELAVSELQDS